MSKVLNENWGVTKNALLEGLQGSVRKTTDVVLENARKQALRESATSGSTGTGNIATVNKIMLPLLRRVMPSTIANEIMGVQPMTGPVGQIHTLRVNYAEDGAGFKAGQEAFNPFDIAKAYSGNNVANSSTSPLPGPSSTASMEGEPGRRMSINVLKETVEVKSRKLSASWTFEAAQDAEAVHGIDIEAEIMEAIAQEITVEIDQELLGRLRNLAGAPAQSYDQNAVSGTATFVGDEHAALATMMNLESNLISQRTRRGVANFAVVSPVALTILQSATTSAFARTTEGKFDAPLNTKLVGTLNNQMKIYVDQFASSDEAVLLGYKGNETDAGAFYCPYIPLQSVGPIIDPTTFQPVVSFMTRYGYCELTNTANSFGNAGDYYSRIGINTSNLSFF